MIEEFTPSEKVIIRRASLIPGLKSLCEAIEITMPKYYKYLRVITSSHAKIISLTGHQIGMWKRFPSIPEIENNNNKDAKAYFSFYVNLLLDRGVLQDSYFRLQDFEVLESPKKSRYSSSGLERILAESEENERYNDRNLQSGSVRLNSENGEVLVYDGANWKRI